MKIAILSDIHSNLAALKAVLADVEAQGCSQIISLGDVVGYHAEPGECIDLLMQHNVKNIMGNHDYYLIGEENCPRSRLVSQIIDYQKGIVTSSQKDWLAQSVSSLIIDDMYMVHGGWKDPMDQYLYKICSSDIPEGARVLFSGHTHVQCLAEFGQRYYCNPGSVGQPRDGDPRAAYAIVDANHIILRRINYDIDKTVQTMIAAGFDSKFYMNLYAGAQIGGRIDKITIEQGDI
jgi:putative phosphoesterase